MDKNRSRQRRSKRSRAKIRELQMTRLCIHKTPSHIYAQLISPCGSQIMAAASTLDKELRAKVKHGGNKEAASMVGDLIAKRATEKNVKRVAFDRSGNKFHGRVKALADAAREGGLEF